MTKKAAPVADDVDALAAFSPPVRTWFTAVFSAPTPAQAGAWSAISTGANTLVVAPTGSGKTLAAFLWALDQTLLPRSEDQPAGTKVLYLSPLKALGTDIERNLRSPLVGIARSAANQGDDTSPVSVGIRTGDTPAAERRRQASNPPDILITTPESLYLLLTSAARSTLQNVHTVIIDEIHAVAGTKRGSHLAVSLARLDAIQEGEAPQRIGLSATVRPVDVVAEFLGGNRPVEVVDPGSKRDLDLTVRVPVPDMTDLAGIPGQQAEALVPSVSQLKDPRVAAEPDEAATARPPTIWPHIEEEIVDRILERTSTIVFTNSRGLAERLTSRLNDIYAHRLEDEEGGAAPVARDHLRSEGTPPALARAHHGSVSKEQRAEIEDALKSGRLKCVVATSSLELGIDMGDVDLVIQVSSPPSVASALQRVGRAGHQVGETSRGVFFPTHRADVVAAAVVTDRMGAGALEALAPPRNPLDILAQQTVAAAALDDVDVDQWFALLRTTFPFAGLPRSIYEATLDMLAGRYPSDDFAELRPRIVWDRAAGVLSGRPGAQRLAVTSGGTIPDRGLFPVFLAGTGEEEGEATGGTKRRAPARVGELDEEMVYESRAGDVIALGASSWRIQEITHDRVSVIPAPGIPGKLPFWHGEGGGRPAELGEATGAFVRTFSPQRAPAALESNARENLAAYLAEQRAATGVLPSDRTLVIERFEDELGDWRIALLSPYGLRVHAPWALAIGERVEERYGTAGDVQASDDGIVLRLPRTDGPPDVLGLVTFEADEIEDIVTRRLGASALFASRFRECAARALLLPRRSPGKRSPLWAQRRRAAQLLDVARQHADFPIIFETLRECLVDVYDVPALRTLLQRIDARDVSFTEVQTAQASPFAQALLFSYVGQFLYEGDQPLAERKAAVLALDQSLLDDLLGRARLRELLDETVIAAAEADLQRTSAERRLPGGQESVADLLRLLGPLSAAELADRLQDADAEAAAAWGDALVTAGRALLLPVTGAERYLGIEDAARIRDVYGVVLPQGIARVFLEPVEAPLSGVVARFARTHGPFTIERASAALGLSAAVVGHALTSLKDDGRVTDGEFTPGMSGTEWVDTRVLQTIRRRSLAALRKEVEPVPEVAYARFLTDWQHLAEPLTGLEGLLTVLDQLAGVPLPASAWETLVLPARIAGYAPHLLDEALSTGEVLFTGSGQLGGDDGWIAFHLVESAALTVPAPEGPAPDGLGERVLQALGSGGGFRHGELLAKLTADGQDVAGEELTRALWDLLWDGRVTNDSYAPVRSLLRRGGTHKSKAAAPRARSSLRRGAGRLRPPRLPRGSLSTASVSGAVTVAAERSAGRWSAVIRPEIEPGLFAAATAELMLDRHGVVTRGSLTREDVPGGFAALYRVLAALEDTGAVRRGHFISRLGGAQFARPGTVDVLRDHARAAEDRDEDAAPTVLALAAADPANPYGAALGWPEPVMLDDAAPRHRPARRAGGIVVLAEGHLVAYLERGGKSLVVFSTEDHMLAGVGAALADVIARGALSRVTIETVAGETIHATSGPARAVRESLASAGFIPTPKGMRLRS